MGAMLAALAAAGCASNPSSALPSAQAFTSRPPSAAFTIAQRLPGPATVSLEGNGANAVGSAFTVTVDDPTQLGAGVSNLDSPSATLYLIPVSSGRTHSTVVRVKNAKGQTTTVTVTQGKCGRPDNLAAQSQLVYPKPGTTGVSPYVNVLYFAVFSRAPITPMNLHLIAGQHATLEGSQLFPALPPSGSKKVAKQPGFVLNYMAATVPRLSRSTSYRTQIYDDTCQPPALTGGFST
jgi:hypothetical protein